MWRRALVLLVLVVPSVPASADAPRRIVSVNMCADQILLALAPDLIAALSPFAADPVLSPDPQAAVRFPRTGGTAEEVLRLAPDLVITGPFSARATRAMFARFAVPVTDLAVPATIQAAVEGTRALAARIGRAEAGERLLAPLLALPDMRPSGEARPRALYLDRRGLVAGRGTIFDDLFRLAGLSNAAPVEGFAMLSVERIAALAPDLLVVHPDRGAADQGTAMLRHPVLARLVPAARRIEVPVAATVCPGPALAAVIERLAAARAAFLDGRPARSM